MMKIVLLVLAIIALSQAAHFPNAENSESTVTIPYERQPSFVISGVKCEDRCDAESDSCVNGQWSVQFFNYTRANLDCGVGFGYQFQPWNVSDSTSLINFAASCTNTAQGARIGMSSATIPVPTTKRNMKHAKQISATVEVFSCEGDNSLGDDDDSTDNAAEEAGAESYAVYVNAWKYGECGFGYNGKKKHYIPYGAHGGYYHNCYVGALPLETTFTCGVQIDPEAPNAEQQSNELPYKCFQYNSRLTCGRDYCGRPNINNCETVLEKPDGFHRGGFVFQTTLNRNQGLNENCVAIPNACQNAAGDRCCAGINYHQCYAQQLFVDELDNGLPNPNEDGRK